MNMELRWSDIDREEPKNLEKTLSQCLFIHKSRMDWTGREALRDRWLTIWAMARHILYLLVYQLI
jgi:hypothetical protein